jgi:hypothetical protein
MDTRRRHPLVPYVAVLVLLLAYVLSYAPLVRWFIARHTRRTGPDSVTIPLVDGEDLPAYRPVDLLIDASPLRAPLLVWAEVWGVRHNFEWTSDGRAYNRANP